MIKINTIKTIINKIKQFLQLNKFYEYFNKTKLDNSTLLSKSSKLSTQDGYSDNCPLTREQYRLLSLHTSINITPAVAREYRFGVKNNMLDTNNVIIKKLVRNMVLGKLTNCDNRGYEFYTYGNLEIVYNTCNRTIVGIKNYKGKFDFDVDKNKKKWIDNFLGLDKLD